jgi:hypothetical protein
MQEESRARKWWHVPPKHRLTFKRTTRHCILEDRIFQTKYGLGDKLTLNDLRCTMVNSCSYYKGMER